ncbi:MAG: pyridine nucleotide-disulfide oxidoreductase, partial [Clostridiales bacterium]|nr:pyridine nucleotide-disulfide oxidoreductase [Clostridiales bacterium]
MEYQNLFRPMQIGSLTYKNRIVSAPMVFGLVSLNPMMRESAQEKLAQRARGGAAAVIVGEVDVNFTDANRVPVPPCDFTNYESDEFRIISSIADTIHTNGALAIMELNHPGSEKDPYPGQKNPVGPVGFVKPNGVQVEVLDQAEMDRIVEEFAVCAKYMVHAGFDGILVHGGHGFLFTQFLSKVTNTRTDMFGGSLENRARFPIQILKAIRDAIGPDHTLDLRISVETGPDGGVT